MADQDKTPTSNYSSHANHPISGQLFTFDKKAGAEAWQKEVQAATGYKPQVFEDNAGQVEAEPTITPDSDASITSAPPADRAPLN